MQTSGRQGATAVAGLVALCATLLLSGCESHASTGSRRTHAATIEGSRAKIYTSVAQLAHDSNVIVIARAGAGHTAKVRGVPFTTTQMSSSTVRSGSIAKSFQLLQIGAPGLTSDMPIVQKKDSYLLFLVPFQNQSGVVPGVYVTVGAAAGLYRASGSTYARMDPLSTALPGRLSPATLSPLVAGQR